MTTVAQWAPDDEITSERLNEMVDAINAFESVVDGTGGYTNGILVTKDSASAYAATFGNLDTTNGYALKVQYGPLSSPTDIASFAAARVSFSQLVHIGGGSVDFTQNATPAAPGALFTRLFADTGGNSGLLNIIAGAGGSARRIIDGGIGTAAGDILQWTASNTPARLAIGTARQNLAANSAASGLAYQDSLQSLMTTTGDVVYAVSANTPTRLAIGTARQNLSVNAGASALAYQASLQSLMTSTGDIVYAASANTPARLAVGGANTVLHGGTTPGYTAIATADIAANAVTQSPAVAVSTTDPTTTSASTVVFADPTLTMTTAGGDVLLWARATINISTAAILYLRSRVDSGAWTVVANVSPPSSSGRQTLSGFARYNGLSASSHVFELGWDTSAGTATAFGGTGERRLMGIELKR